MSFTKSKDLKCGVVLRDLESLLKKNLGEQTIVLEQKTRSFLQKGEHFGSTILKVSAKIRKDENAQTEDLELIAKMIPTTEFQRTMVSPTVTFKKELFAYEQLFPTYKEVQKEAGLEDVELLDILPKHYGCRLSLNSESQEADDDVIILMENLRKCGFRTMDRKNGLDLSHAKMAIKNLATYHAVGIVCNKRKPEFIKIAQATTQVQPFAKVEEFGFVIDKTIEIICSDPRVKAYEDRIKKCLDVGFKEILQPAPTNEWSTYTHGDFWANNILFHHDECGNPDKVKFIDFQFMQHDTCLRDLPYFLFVGCSMQVLNDYLEELLTEYHAVFVDTLKRLKFDTKTYSKEQFDERLRKDAGVTLEFIIITLKLTTNDVGEDFDLNNMIYLITSSEVNDIFRERMFVAIETFVAKNWI